MFRDQFSPSQINTLVPPTTKKTPKFYCEVDNSVAQSVTIADVLSFYQTLLLGELTALGVPDDKALQALLPIIPEHSSLGVKVGQYQQNVSTLINFNENELMEAAYTLDGLLTGRISLKTIWTDKLVALADWITTIQSNLPSGNQESRLYVAPMDEKLQAIMQRFFLIRSASGLGSGTDLVENKFNSLRQDIKAQIEANKKENPLHVAIHCNEIDIVKAFIAQKVNVNELWDGQSALYLACRMGHVDIVKVLLENDADINSGESPLIKAYEKGHRDIVSILLTHVVANKITLSETVKFRLLNKACDIGDVGMATLMLKLGASINKEDHWQSPLVVAYEGGRRDVVNALQAYVIEKKITLSEEVKFRLLTYACQIGDVNVVSLLLENDISLNKNNGQLEQFPLFIACKEGHLEIVRLLLRKNAKLLSEEIQYDKGADVKNKVGYFLLIQACLTDNASMVTLLLEYGVSVNAENIKLEESPLSAACQTGSLPIVELLIKAGADMGGATLPSHVIHEGKHLKIINFLLQPNLLSQLRFDNFIRYKTDERSDLLAVVSEIIETAGNESIAALLVSYKNHLLEQNKLRSKIDSPIHESQNKFSEIKACEKLISYLKDETETALTREDIAVLQKGNLSEIFPNIAKRISERVQQHEIENLEEQTRKNSPKDAFL